MNNSVALDALSQEFLDANILVRYFMGDGGDHASRAAALIESERSFRISVAVLAEVGFVLTKVYQVPRIETVQGLIALLNRENIEAHEIATETAIQGLNYCAPSGRVSFNDAMLWAVARAAAPARVWTFDQRFPKEGIERREP